MDQVSPLRDPNGYIDGNLEFEFENDKMENGHKNRVLRYN